MAARPAAAAASTGPVVVVVVVVDRRDGELRAFLAPPGPCPVRAAGGGFARPLRRAALGRHRLLTSGLDGQQAPTLASHPGLARPGPALRRPGLTLRVIRRV